MKKHQVDHVLRAASRVTGEKLFVIVGSQALHGKFPDLPDAILRSVEVDIMAARSVETTEWLNVIGMDSPFHATYGYFADPVDERTAVVPRGWRGRLVNLPPGDTEGARGLCLEPHDLAIAKYVARRPKDVVFTRQMVQRGIIQRERLLELLPKTPVTEAVRASMRASIEADFSFVERNR